jgi:hypothetical protein
MLNPLRAWKELGLLKEIGSMNTTDALAVAKAHPDVVTSLLGALFGAVQADPTIVPDVITAVETKNYTGLALKHIGLLLSLAGIIGGKPELVAQLGALAKG